MWLKRKTTPHLLWTKTTPTPAVDQNDPNTCCGPKRPQHLLWTKTAPHQLLEKTTYTLYGPKRPHTSCGPCWRLLADPLAVSIQRCNPLSRKSPGSAAVSTLGRDWKGVGGGGVYGVCLPACVCVCETQRESWEREREKENYRLFRGSKLGWWVGSWSIELNEWKSHLSHCVPSSPWFLLIRKEYTSIH